MFTFNGRHAVLKDVPGYRGSPPGSRPSILIGGSGPRTTPRLAAGYADEYNVPVRSLDITRAQFERVKQACDRLGRDPGSIVLSAAQVLCTGESAAEVARRADRLGRSAEDLAAAGLAGTVDEVTEKIGAFADIGATRLYLQCLDLSDPEQLHLVAERIMPLVGHHHQPAVPGNPRDPGSGKHDRLERPS
jgi:alkanesulfonate monooxygenase SsuD/methylene tetrahydromethanopterin reductase-like flavin-dependent oxidoreductase (luciferase family)